MKVSISMSVSSLKSMLAVVVAVCAVSNVAESFNFKVPGLPNGNAFSGRTLFKQMEDAKDELESRLPAGFVKKWTRLVPAVKHMAVELPLTEISSQDNKQTVQSSSKVKDIGFSWKSCGPANQSVEIRKLNFAPSPLYFPGPLTFGFDIVFHDSFAQDAKVSADLLLEYSARTGTWVKIPCVGGLGSCTYGDVCSMSQAIVCPDELKQRGIPCTCPIVKGEYILPSFSVDVLASVFLSGDYRGKVVFTDSHIGQIGCYQVTFTVG